MSARFIGITLCSVLSAWPLLTHAEQTPAPSKPGQQTAEPVAATPEHQAAPDLGAGDSDVEQARSLFWSAHERYDAGEYAEAAKLFEQSYAVFPQAEVLFNIALARARSGRCRDAEQAFEEYSRAVDASEATRAAQENFRDLLTQCTPVSGQAAPSVADLPEPAPRAVAPEAPPAPKPDLAAIELPQLSSEVLDTPPPSYWTTQRVVGWSLLGTAAVATGVAVYFDNQRRDAHEAYEELSQAPPEDAGDQVADLEEKHQRAQIGIGAATAAALGCAAVGAGLLIYSGEGVASAGAQLAVDPAGARIGLSGRF